MPTTKHTEYLDLLTSMDRNTTRRATHHLGRYHGFDTMGAGAGGNIPIAISHAETVDYVDNTNTKVSVASFVTGHGLVVTTDEEPNVEVLANSSGVTHYQVLYAEYAWADVPGGSNVEYGTDSTLTVEPTTPPSMIAIRTPLGYFTILDGATDISKVSYTPYPIPNLAGKADVDLSLYALLAGANKFSHLNVWNSEDVPKASLVVNPVQDPFYDLELPSNANILNIAALDAGTYGIYDVTFPSGRSKSNGEVFFIYFAPCEAVLSWNPENFDFGLNDNQLSLVAGASYIFARVDGVYRIMSMPSDITQALAALASRVTTNETEIATQNERLLAVENGSIPWFSLIPSGSTVGDWTINYLQTGTLRGLTYIRASVGIAAGIAAGITTLGPQMLGTNQTLSAPHHSGGADELQSGITVRLTTNGNTVSLVHPTIAAGDERIYTLPATVIT